MTIINEPDSLMVMIADKEFFRIDPDRKVFCRNDAGEMVEVSLPETRIVALLALKESSHNARDALVKILGVLAAELAVSHAITSHLS